MFKYLMLAGLALFLPGLYALGYSIFEGPSAWMVDSRTFWGTPICLFVFWIGLAHAGTLLSAIFLALDIKLDRRTALIAELSTLVSLVFAAVFPLVHLGVIDNFYMVAPFLPRCPRQLCQCAFAPGLGFLLHCRVCAPVALVLWRAFKIPREPAAGTLPQAYGVAPVPAGALGAYGGEPGFCNHVRAGVARCVLPGLLYRGGDPFGACPHEPPDLRRRLPRAPLGTPAAYDYSAGRPSSPQFRNGYQLDKWVFYYGVDFVSYTNLPLLAEADFKSHTAVLMSFEVGIKSGDNPATFWSFVMSFMI